MLNLYVDNDQTITVQIQDVTTNPPQWLNNTTITGTLNDNNNQPIGSVITGTYVTNSNGTYQFKIPASQITTTGTGSFVITDSNSFNVTVLATYVTRIL